MARKRRLPQDAYSVAEFCRTHNIGKTTYYRLKQQGRAPKEMRIGTRRLISREAAEQWRQAREQEA